MPQLQVLQNERPPQLDHELLRVLLDELLHDPDDLLGLGPAEQFLLDQGDELLLDDAHVEDALLLQPGPDVALQHHTFGQLVPVDLVGPQLGLVAGYEHLELPLLLFVLLLHLLMPLDFLQLGQLELDLAHLLPLQLLLLIPVLKCPVDLHLLIVVLVLLQFEHHLILCAVVVLLDFDGLAGVCFHPLCGGNVGHFLLG